MCWDEKYRSKVLNNAPGTEKNPIIYSNLTVTLDRHLAVTLTTGRSVIAEEKHSDFKK